MPKGYFLWSCYLWAAKPRLGKRNPLAGVKFGYKAKINILIYITFQPTVELVEEVVPSLPNPGVWTCFLAGKLASSFGHHLEYSQPRNNFGVSSFGWRNWPNKAKKAKFHSGYLRESELRTSHTRAHKVLPWNNAILLDEQWNKCSISNSFPSATNICFSRFQVYATTNPTWCACSPIRIFKMADKPKK